MALVAALTFAVQAPAQSGCWDPPVQGFVDTWQDNLVTLTDGYQTRFDVYFPVRPPGPCGWPTILLVHANRGSKEAMEEHARRWAGRGYFAIAFDLRGQGPSMALNNPAVYGRGPLGLRERLDVVEVIEAAESTFPARIDMNRLGLTGPTQGGFYGWAMAAHSGKLPPPNPWRSTRFPEFAAVAVHDFDVDTWEWLVPGETNVSQMFVYNVLQSTSGLTVDPAFQAAALPLVLAEDYAALRALVDLQVLDLPTLLQTSDVPILATLSYDDMFGSATRTVEEWSNIAPGAVKCLNLTNSGHQSPNNNRERALRRQREEVWFDYHLRGVGNPSTALRAFRYALIPNETTVCLDPASLWDAHESDQDPLQAATVMRFYLGESAVLSPSPTVVGTGTETIRNVNATGYTIADYIADELSAEEMLQRIPLDSEAYDAAPQPVDTFVVGVAHAHLPIQTAASDFLVNVSLIDVGPTGGKRYITGGFKTVRGHPGGLVDVEIPIAAYGYRLAAGHRLRVQVENHAWHRPPMQPNAAGVVPSFLRALPVFTPFTMRVVRGSGNQPWVEIPAIQPDGVRTGADLAVLREADPEDLRLAVFSDAAHAGWRFQFLASFSGTQGSFQWQGSTIPMVGDTLTAVILGLGSGGPLMSMRGLLDADGSGTGQLPLGNLSALPAGAAGLSLVTRITDGLGTAEVSGAMTIPID